ncbi:MAG: FG-GAP repeat protein, partial [Rhodothermales bacterium]|nr:FG-GAP repeat protein [Rhodothermales bacterium]
MKKTVQLRIVMSAPGPIVGFGILMLLLAATMPALAQTPDTLFASDGAHADRFGYSVDIDGDVAVVGASNTNGGMGTAYVFRHDGSRWNEEAVLTAPDGAAMDNFGFAVAVSGDNIVVGAPMKDDRVGGAYAFRYLASRWTTYQVLVPPVNTWPASFGWSIDVDGDRLAIGAPGDGENGASSGAAFVYTFTGPAWIPDAKVTASDGDLSDFLGTSLALGP